MERIPRNTIRIFFFRRTRIEFFHTAHSDSETTDTCTQCVGLKRERDEYIGINHQRVYEVKREEDGNEYENDGGM